MAEEKERERYTVDGERPETKPLLEGLLPQKCQNESPGFSRAVLLKSRPTLD